MGGDVTLISCCDIQATGHDKDTHLSQHAGSAGVLDMTEERLASKCSVKCQGQGQGKQRQPCHAELLTKTWSIT